VKAHQAHWLGRGHAARSRRDNRRSAGLGKRITTGLRDGPSNRAEGIAGRIRLEQITADPRLRTLRNLNTREDYQQALADPG
jgi:hypothetical protein